MSRRMKTPGLAAAIAMMMVLLVMGGKVSHAITLEVLAVVNGTPITNLDFAERRNFIVKTTGINENNPQIDSDVMQMLIDDVIKRDESRRLGASVERNAKSRATELVDSAFSQGGNDADTVLQSLGIDRAFAEEKYLTDVLWVTAVRSRFTNEFANIRSEAENELERIKTNAEKEQIDLDEIVLLPGPGRNIEATKAIAREMIAAIKNGGADFANIAGQFSAAGSAQNGGRVGWVVAERLPREVRIAIAGLGDGALSAPVETGGAVAIYRLRARRAAGNPADLPSLAEVENSIGNRHFSVLSSRYLAQLRRKAIIEYKTGLGG